MEITNFFRHYFLSRTEVNLYHVHCFKCCYLAGSSHQPLPTEKNVFNRKVCWGKTSTLCRWFQKADMVGMAFSAFQSAYKAIRQVWWEEYSFQGKGRLLPNHDLLFAKYAITLQKKNPEIPKTIRNQSLLVSVRRKKYNWEWLHG